jgi:predicted nucleic acid-binding Zn finger protein
MKKIQWELLQIFCNQKIQNQYDFFRGISFILYDDRKLLDSSLDVLSNLQYISKYICNNNGDNRTNDGSYNSNSNREVYIVSGSRDNQYMCLKRSCTCRHYLELTRQSFNYHDPIVCKHLVAVQIARASGLIKESVSTLFHFDILSKKPFFLSFFLC